MFSFRTTPIEDQLDKALIDGRVGCFCTQNSWDPDRRRYLHDLFRERGNLDVLFTPGGTELSPDARHIDFDPQRLHGLDALVIEIQDAGVRYFRYTQDVFHLMDVLKLLDDDAPSLYIVDHINPAGRVVEGTIPSGESDLHVPKVAHRHGLTLGELCNLYYTEISARYPLHVISAMASGTTRQLLPWAIAPAPDLPGLFTPYLYSGGGLWDHTTLSPGIGTARPYEYIGAPFLTPAPADTLPAAPGVLLRPASFTPAYGRYAGEPCYGYQLLLVPGEDYHSLLHTLRLIRHFADRFSAFELADSFYRRLADPVLADFVGGFISLDQVRAHIKVEEQKWIRKAKRFLLYDDPPFRMK